MRARSSKLISDILDPLYAQYPHGAPYQVIVSAIARNNPAMRIDNIKRAIERAIERGHLFRAADGSISATS